MNDLQKNLDWAYKNLELMTVENMIKEIEKLEYRIINFSRKNK